MGEVRADVPGLEIVVDIDHLRVPEKPLCVFDETGRLLGQIITDYTRHHVLVDWTGDGNKEIGSALPRGLFDGRGERIVTFDIGDDERPAVMATGDMTGDGVDDVLLTTGRDGVYKVCLYKNDSAPSVKGRRLTGTGTNFTLY